MIAAAPPAGVYTYASTMNGANVGRTKITVTPKANGMTIVESASGTANGQSASVSDTYAVDAQLDPVSYAATASLADSRNMRASLKFNGGRALQTGDVNMTYDLQGTTKHFVLLDVGPFSGFFALPAQLQAWKNVDVTAVVPDFARSLVLVNDTSATPSRPANVPKSDGFYAFTSPLAFTVWYDPKTLVVDELDVPAQGVTVRRIASI